MERKEIEEKINGIAKQIVEKYQPIKIVLFGSGAKSKGDVNDIDLILIKEDVPYYGAERMRELYCLIETDIAVDFLVYKPHEWKKRLIMGDPFVKQIERKGKVLYG